MLKIKFHITVIIFIILVLSAACGGRQPVRLQPGPVSQPVKQPPAPPVPPADDIIDEDIPELPTVEVKNPYEQYESRRYDFDLQSGNVVEVLRALIKGTDIGLVIDPGISSTNIPIMDLKGATLKQILSYILPPLKLKYRWEGKNLHIFRNPLVTRYYNVDYLAAGRKGTRNVSFSTRSGGNSGMGGGMGGSSGSVGGMSGGTGSSGGSSGMGGGGQNQSSSEISVEYENSVWNTLTDSLKVLVFGSLQVQGQQSQGQQGQGGQSSSREAEAPRSFAFSDPASGKQLVVSPNTGIVMVTAVEEDLHKIGRFIDKYAGSSRRQVWLEAKIMEVDLGKAYQLGVNWAGVLNRGGFRDNLAPVRSLPNPAAAFTTGNVETQALDSSGAFQFAVTNNALDILVDAISRQGNLKVLANPRLSTLNNEKAVIRVVREEAFFNLQTQISQGIGGNVTAPTINVSVIPIGIVMDVLPQVSEDGDITLSINPDISELLEIRSFEVEGALATQPVIDRRSIDTVAKLKNGQTLVIAGIIKERKSEILKGVPFLYKVPLLGNLFRRTEQQSVRTELVIFITPRLLSGKAAKELTLAEKKRIKDAMFPVHVGDTFMLDEGMKGETSHLKKKQKN